MPAAGIVNPTIDVTGNFQQGRQDAAVNESNDMANQVHQIEILASGAAHAMPQGPNGPVDPAKWNEVLDTFEQTGMDPEKVKQLRDHPEVAAVVLKGSANALKAQADAATFEQQKQLLDAQIAQALSATAKNSAGPDPTTLMQNIEAGGLKPGSPEYQKAILDGVNKSGVNVNVGPTGIDYGDPGTGYVWQRDAEGKITLDDRGAPVAIPFKGGKPYADQQRADEADKNKTDQKNVNASVVVQDIDRALKQISDDPFWTTGAASQATGWIGNSPAGNVAALIDTAEANSGFDKLQAMREASPTGGALGSVSTVELELLQSAIGSLKQSQGPEQLQDNLRRVKNIYLDIIHGPGNGPPREKLTFEETPTGDAPEDKGGSGGSEKGAKKTLGGKTYINGGGGPDDWYEAD